VWADRPSRGAPAGLGLPFDESRRRAGGSGIGVIRATEAVVGGRQTARSRAGLRSTDRAKQLPQLTGAFAWERDGAALLRERKEAALRPATSVPEACGAAVTGPRSPSRPRQPQRHSCEGKERRVVRGGAAIHVPCAGFRPVAGRAGASEAGSGEAGMIESSSAGGHAASWAARVRALMACS
jgi:hypothetical protein